MTMTNTAVPPHVQLIQMSTACWVSQLVSTAANMGLADHLAPGPKSAATLAVDLGANRRVTRVVPTASDVSIVEAELA